MDGLDIKIMNLSFLLKNRVFRIDSTYYDKVACDRGEKIQSMKHFYFPEKEVVSGPFGSSLTSDAYQTEGIPFIRISDIKGGFTINPTDMIYISEKDNERLKSSQLTLNDIILSKVGNSVGYYARVDEKIQNCNISENNIGVKLHNLELSDEQKHYILTYLNSKYGNVLTLRRSSGNAQPKLNVFDVAEIPIPFVSNEFSALISKAVLESQKILELANVIYQQVENKLLSEIGIDISTINSGNVSIKSFADSFETTGRLDAEYFQKKYYELIDKLKSRDTIESACYLYEDTYVPDKGKCYDYIELANIGQCGEIYGVERVLGNELPSRARRLVKAGQVVVSSIEGSLQSCAIITEDFDNAICSTGFYVIDSENYNSETLLVLLKSAPIQLLLKRSCSGTILTNITKDDFLNIPLPPVNSEIQLEVQKKVQEMYFLRKKSKQVLEYAKRAVEIAIEQGESDAITWIENKLKEIAI